MKDNFLLIYTQADSFHFCYSLLQMTFTEVMKSNSLFPFCHLLLSHPHTETWTAINHKSGLIYAGIWYLIYYLKGILFPFHHHPHKKRSKVNKHFEETQGKNYYEVCFKIFYWSPPYILRSARRHFHWLWWQAKGATVTKLTRSHFKSQLLLSTKLPQKIKSSAPQEAYASIPLVNQPMD